MKLKINFNNQLLKTGKLIVELLNKNGHEAYWVGGTVRDLILKRPLDNLDIASNARPDEVEKILSKEKIISIDFGKTFGTIVAILNGLNIEITTFRAEGRYSDRRHPDAVKFINDYKEDAQRRDFTINGLYLDVKSGEVLDVVGGLADIKRKLIKFIGNPKHRIDEDALRMIRAVRFAVTFGFKIEKNSFAAIKTRAKFIQDVSGERIKAEFDKILLSPNKEQGIRLLDEIGLLKFLIPDFNKLKHVVHNSKYFHLEGNVYKHTLMALKHVEDLDETYAILFHDLGKINLIKKVLIEGRWVNKFSGHSKLSAELFNQFANRLRFGKKERNLVRWLVLHHDDRTEFQKKVLIQQIEYVLHPDFSKLLMIWRADSLANLKILDDGFVGSLLSPSYVLAMNLLKKVNSKMLLINKLANGNMIQKYSKMRPGTAIKRKIFEIIEKIYLSEIKNVTDLKNFLKNNAKTLDN